MTSPGDAGDAGDAGGAAGSGLGLFAGIRRAAALVAGAARQVTVDEDALDHLAGSLDPDDPPPLPEEVPTGDDESMAGEVVVWNAVNFGSGWFPVLRKREGLSGARSLAESLADHVARAGVPTAGWLSQVDPTTCAEVFGQPYPGTVDDLLDLFARAWRDLGDLLLDRFGGSPAELVRSAGGSAERLVTILATMPLARDVATYALGAGGDGMIEVPFHKRAQITVSHLGRAFGHRGLGRFDDVAELTAFADNLVPHVLRMAGALVYDHGLERRIDAGELLDPGSPEEVEIRACGLHAVEVLAAGTGLSPATIDHQLWQRGQDPAIKAVPRHRCRCSWY